MRRFIRAVSSGLISVGVFLIFLEIGSFVAIKAGWFDVELPGYSLSGSDFFWKIINPNFGVWHEANDTMAHRGRCYDVTYKSNSLGMRDNEIAKVARGHRVVVLGDSFVDGWGVDFGQRFTETL
jgi:hypothetical protein